MRFDHCPLLIKWNTFNIDWQLIFWPLEAWNLKLLSLINLSLNLRRYVVKPDIDHKLLKQIVTKSLTWGDPFIWISYKHFLYEILNLTSKKFLIWSIFDIETTSKSQFWDLKLAFESLNKLFLTSESPDCCPIAYDGTAKCTSGCFAAYY